MTEIAQDFMKYVRAPEINLGKYQLGIKGSNPPEALVAAQLTASNSFSDPENGRY